jgi:hypothetical protein
LQKWYEGKWYNKVSSYAVYPIGLSLEPGNHTRGGGGGLTALLTLGYQDRDGYAVRLNVKKLLGMLDIVSQC